MKESARNLICLCALCSYVWLCVVMCGYVWLCVVMCSYEWL